MEWRVEWRVERRRWRGCGRDSRAGRRPAMAGCGGHGFPSTVHHLLPALQAGAIGQEYGKFGIIRETDIYSKRPEFQLWAIEVRLVLCGRLGCWQLPSGCTSQAPRGTSCGPSRCGLLPLWVGHKRAVAVVACIGL